MKKARGLHRREEEEELTPLEEIIKREGQLNKAKREEAELTLN